MQAMAKRLSFVFLLGAGCSGSDPLQSFDVTLATTSECTVTGDFSQTCEPADVLAAVTKTARWTVENGPSETVSRYPSFVVTLEDGEALPGITFDDDGLALEASVGCPGEGGRCFFARISEQSVDARDNNCGKFRERFVLFHTLKDDDTQIAGVRSVLFGNDEACGTPTTSQTLESISGSLAPSDALASTRFAPKEST
jgi:hypothetical protein